MSDLQLRDSQFPYAGLASSFPKTPTLSQAGKTHWLRKVWLSQMKLVYGVVVVYLLVF